MRYAPPRLIASLAAALLLALPFVLGSCGNSGNAAVPQLFIVTPHGTDIRREFGIAFAKWHLEKYGTPVKLEWPDLGGGGTGNIVRTLDATYARGPSSGYDLIWGGGSATFNDFIAHDYLRKPNLPDAVLNQVPHDIFGTPLHGPGDVWIGATMSNFGIVINKDRIRELGLSTPRRWTDIASADWLGQLSLADPSKSGSVRTSYEMVLQQYGWEKGWQLLTLMFANAGTLREGGATPAEDVGSAQEVAGIVIDFYGRKQVIRIGPSLLGFVVPEGGSTIDPDPIAMLKGAPHAELAAHFIEFVISPAGQRLWVFRAGTPGGPVQHALGRMTILPELYAKDAQYMLDPTDPFTSVAPLKEDVAVERARTGFLGDIIKSEMVDNWRALVAARTAVKVAGDPPELLARFGELPTFVPTTVDAGRSLVDGEPRAITGDLEVQQAAGEEFKPSSPEKKPYTEQLQTQMKERWRKEGAARFAAIQAAAESLRK